MTQNSLPPRIGFGPTTLKIALLMVIVEIFIMLGFDWFGGQLPEWKIALLDAVLLASIVAPVAYFVFVRPRDQQIRAVMAALEQARLEAENLARFDALTGVLSRRVLLEVLDEEIERTKRYGHDLVCLMLDIDHFKIFNDTYGHQFGDKVLHRIARVITDQCRANDHVGRYGGEEFLVVLPETRINGASVFAERVRLAVAETSLDLKEERITLSIGVAEWRDADGTTSSLISHADRALLEAKAAGRNRIAVREPV